MGACGWMSVWVGVGCLCACGWVGGWGGGGRLQPYNVNVAAEAMARAAIAHREAILVTVRSLIHQRDR